MLLSVEQPREFPCPHYGDGNCSNLTTKLTDPTLRKRMCSQTLSTDGLDSSIYNILTTTWKKTSETGLQTFPTRRPCIQIPGLPHGVVALAPEKFWYNAGHGRRAYLEQFALTLAYARTDYKAQGQTMLRGAVLDIQRPARGSSASASPYAQLSRVPSLDMVFILRPFDPAELRRPLSDKLLAELAWEEEMAKKMKRLYGM